MGEEKYPDIIELKLKLHFSAKDSQIRQIMKRFIIEVPDAAVSRIEKGLRCRASVFMIDKGLLGLKPNKHQVGRHNKAEMIHTLEYGWVKATDDNYIIRECLPKTMGPVQMLHTIDRDMNTAKNAILDCEIIDRV